MANLPSSEMDLPSWERPFGATYSAAGVCPTHGHKWFPEVGPGDVFSCSSGSSSYPVGLTGRTFPSNPFMVLPTRGSAATGRTLTSGRTPPMNALKRSVELTQTRRTGVQSNARSRFASFERASGTRQKPIPALRHTHPGSSARPFDGCEHMVFLA